MLHRLSYANVMSTMAVMLTLGGVSYAATALPRNSVGPKQIRRGAVTAAKVRPGSLLARDFARGQLPAGPRGPVGPMGPVGPVGATGPKGDSGLATVVVRSAIDPNVASGKEGALDVACNVGEWATGGGAYFPMGSANDRLATSFPVRMVRNASGDPIGEGGAEGKQPDGWEVNAVNGGASPRDLVGYVICVAP